MSTPLPSRHNSQPQAWLPFVSKLRLLIGRRSLPDAALQEAFGARLSQGDPAMDALVEWMFEEGMANTKPLFLQALEHGVHSLDDCPEPLQRFFALVEKRPDWVDEGLLARGARATAMLSEPLFTGLRDFVLMGGYLSSSINEVLARSGGLENGPVKRLAETTHWLVEVTEPGGLERYSPGFIATLRVRWVHALVRRHIRQQADWDAAQHGLPVNQTDMIATWLGFAVGGPLSAMLQGQLVLSPKDLKAYLHLHKYAHWLMGVDPGFLSDDLAHCAWLLANNTLTQPGPTPVCIQMAQALADYKLHQQYPRFGRWRGRWERHQQLSRTHYFLGRQSLHTLGLSRAHTPWWPLLALPGRTLISLGRRFALPGQRAALARQGRATQRRLLEEIYLGLDRQWAPEQLSSAGAIAP